MAAETTYTPEDIKARLARDLPQWSFEDGHIKRRYKTSKWPETLMFLNAVGYLAEQADHHPDLAASYASLEVKLMTHSAGGITDKDLDLAIKIEALAP